MARLIDADALIADHCDGCNYMETHLCSLEDPVCGAVQCIVEAPTIDAVEVVRCKDCKYYRPGKHFTDINFCQRLPYYAQKGGLNTADDDFCSYGERKEKCD